MKELDLIQGTPEWLAVRAQHRCASDAPVMMGTSSTEQRNQLLARLKSGAPKEFSDFVQERVLNPGHDKEAAARPFAGNIIGQSLYPKTVTDDDGYLLASLDGMTMDDTIIWEHKSANVSNILQVADGECPPENYWQVVQELYITGAEKCLFMVSDGTEANSASMWIEPNPADFLRLLDGWAQFDKDLETFTPSLMPEMPKAEVKIALPALVIHARGEITTSNMKEYGTALATRLAEVRAIALVTDQDFSNAKESARLLRENIVQAKAAKDAMLAQTVTVGEAARMIDAWCEDMRLTALQLEKDVEKADKTKKAEIVKTGQEKFLQHLGAIQTELTAFYDGIELKVQAPDFWEAIKNKRTFESMQNSVDTMLANAKIGADTTARDYRAKLTWINANGKDYAYPDIQTLLIKPMDDFQLSIKARIERIEADAERVRKEKADREAADALARQEAAKPATVQPVVAQPSNVMPIRPAPVSSSPAAASAALSSKQPAEAFKPMTLGAIKDRLGLMVTAELLEKLGFMPAWPDPRAKLYRDTDYPNICLALIRHIESTFDHPASGIAIKSSAIVTD